MKGLNALIATVSTPLAAPVVCATRLRKGTAYSVRGAHRLVADAIRAAKAAGATGMVVLRADSAFYSQPVVAAARRAGARFSITARMTPAVAAAIAAIADSDDAWTPITYPNAIWDETEQRLISDAEVAETSFTAFRRRNAGEQVAARLIVRRVKRLNPPGEADGQGELFTTWRYHAVFTDTPLPMLQAEQTHRGHAVIEQVIADLKNSALAHLPSGKFTANAAWLALAAIAFNLTRAAGCLSSTFHARATTATIRTQLITVPARIARSARRLVLHLPRDWPWQHDWTQLHNQSGSPPTPATT